MCIASRTIGYYFLSNTNYVPLLFDRTHEREVKLELLTLSVYNVSLMETLFIDEIMIIQGRPLGGCGMPVYPKKLNTQNSSKYTQKYTQVYLIPEIQRKWYTEYPYLSCNILYPRFKKPRIPYTQKPWPTLIIAHLIIHMNTS